MQLFFYYSKVIPSQMSTRGNYVVKKGQNLINVVFERPLLSDGMQSSVSCLVVLIFLAVTYMPERLQVSVHSLLIDTIDF